MALSIAKQQVDSTRLDVESAHLKGALPRPFYDTLSKDLKRTSCVALRKMTQRSESLVRMSYSKVAGTFDTRRPSDEVTSLEGDLSEHVKEKDENE